MKFLLDNFQIGNYIINKRRYYMQNKSAILKIFHGERGNSESLKCSQQYLKLLNKVVDNE